MKQRRVVLAIVMSCAGFGAVGGSALADPTGIEWTEDKNAKYGTIVGDTIYSTAEKKLYLDVLGTTSGSELTVSIMGGQILGTGKGKDGLTTVKLKEFEGLVEGSFAIEVVETPKEGMASAPVGGATLVVDRTAPAAPTGLEFGMATTAVWPSADVLTPNVPVALEAMAEADSNIFLAVNGKLKNPQLKKAAQDRAGVTDGAGEYESEFDWEKSRTYLLVGGDPDKPLKLKLKEGGNELAIVAMDLAGNVSGLSNAIAFDFVTKAPKPAKDLVPVGLDIMQVGTHYNVGVARPTFRGRAESGMTVELLVDGVSVGSTFVDSTEIFYVTPDSDISMGEHEVTAEVYNEALLASKPSNTVTINVMVGAVETGLPADDFNDNSLNPVLWTLFEPTPASLKAAEVNQRLAFQKPATSGDLVFSAYLSNDWALDLNEDFAIAVKYKMIQDVFDGDAGLFIAFVDDVDFMTGQILNGIAVSLGTDDTDGYFSMQRTVSGTDLEEFFEYDRDTSGNGVLQYDALTDTLWAGSKLNDPDAVSLGGLRSASPSEQSSIMLGGYAEGDVPESDGSDAWLDSFEVLQGVVVHGAIAPPAMLIADTAWMRRQTAADVNGDGVVSSGDMELVLQAMGATGDGLAEDVDSDGQVTASDLREVLLRIGLATPEVGSGGQ